MSVNETRGKSWDEINKQHEKKKGEKRHWDEGVTNAKGKKWKGKKKVEQ